MSTLAAPLEETVGAQADERAPQGHLVCVVGAHGGAGATRIALFVADESGPDAGLIDADLSGGDTRDALGLPLRHADAGLAAVGAVDGATLVDGSRRTAFGWHYEASPRPDLAWLIRDGAMRDLVRVGLRRSPFVVVDAGRPTGPSFEPVLDADIVVLVGSVARVEAIERSRQRLIRAGADARRIIDCPTASGIVERAVGRLRRDPGVIDVDRDDHLMLLIEGRLAALGRRDRS
ncbi:MAG: hypothetical protein ACR2JV_03580 [Gaiellales bacterium]